MLAPGRAGRSPSGSPGGVLGYHHHGSRGLSRRSFRSLAAGAETADAFLGLTPWSGKPAHAASANGSAPRPIPGGSPVIEGAFAKLFDVFVPGTIDPADAEPSSITDCIGVLGHALIGESGTRTDKATETTSTNPLEADIRFMSGLYIGTDGRSHSGAFGFI